jgi:hypothetical protein
MNDPLHNVDIVEHARFNIIANILQFIVPIIGRNVAASVLYSRHERAEISR